MTAQSITLVTAIIGAVCGVTGAVLGVINTYHQLQRNKLRLKVVPKHAIPYGAVAQERINFGVDVINLSEFAVDISDVGFLLKDGRHATLGPAAGLEPDGKLPIRLEPRAKYSKFFRLSPETLEPTLIEAAYARTQCGSIVPGTSAALKALIKEERPDGE